MDLATNIGEYLKAGFAGLWIRSFEHDEAERELAALCYRNEWALARWDIDRGMELDGARDAAATDPLAALRALGSLPTSKERRLLVMRNLNRFLGSPEIAQAIDTSIAEGKLSGCNLIGLSPTVELPEEIARQFVVIDHDLPNRDQLHSIARTVGTEPGELPAGADLESLLDASAGLTRIEAEGAYSLSLVRHGRIRPDEVWELKTQALKKTGLLELHRGGERFDDLGGMQGLKDFCLAALRPGAPRNARPRGVMLLGVPGTGKSALAKALGNETGRPTLTLNVGTLMASLVGQSEERTRQALRTADAMAPCVLFIDEIEKSFSGAAASGTTDGGTSSRIFQTFLTWMNDHTTDVFLIATANRLDLLPAEFTRAERWDGIYFLDFPGPQERNRIWEIHTRGFGIDPAQQRPNDSQWTGAEIRSCCRLAALLEEPLTRAARRIVPVAISAAEQLARLRTAAHNSFLSAETGDVYQSTTPARNATQTKPGRKIQRPTDTNPNPELN